VLKPQLPESLPTGREVGVLFGDRVDSLGKVKMKDDQTCLGCRFFVRSVDAVHGGLGYCQRYAPRPKLLPEWNDLRVVWPLVDRDDSCGEWEEKEGEGYRALVGGAE